MGYFVVENFSLGLDARKNILTLPPGALYSAKNANITRGGELEAAKAFVSKYALPAGQTFGMVSAAGKLYTFGSGAAPAMPAGVIYQRLQHPTGTAMTGIVHATVVKGKVFVIANFTGGLGVFYNGAIVTDWLPSGAGVANYNDVAANFATVIGSNPSFLASAAGPVVTITGPPGVAYTVSATAIDGGGTNDQTATVAITQNISTPIPETLATGTITFNGVTQVFDPDQGRFVSALACESVTVNGVEILGYNVYADDDAGAAGAVASYINFNAAFPRYVASASGNVVTLTASAGTGATPNGYGVGVTTQFGGTVTSNMTGGINVSSSLPQISTVTFAGTWQAADAYSITLNGVVFLISGVGAAGLLPTFAMTKRSKTYALAGPNLLGSKIGDATVWNSGTGSFITDMSAELAGAETLTAMAPFQGNTAIFSRTTTQIWALDPDPSNNNQLQVMQSIGTLAPKSVTAFGDSDVFFLSDTGLRSLKVRINTDNATLSDIGSPVDPVIIAAIKAAGISAKNAVSAIEPVDGRFLLQIGTTTYVFSFFPNAKVSGWTTYDSGLAITDFAVNGTQLYARAGDVIFLLGGDGNDQYAQQPFDVKLPFLSARQIATLKHFTGIDVACDGTFIVSISTDPGVPTDEEEIAIVTKPTYGLGGSPFDGEDVSALSLRFVGRPGKYGKIANVALHYEALGEAV